MPAETLLARILAAAGGSAYLRRVGFRCEHAGDGSARARLEYTDANANRAGAVHGGAIATLLLGAAELAAASTERDAHDRDLRPAMLSVAFLGGVRAASDIVATARVLRRGRDTIHVSVEAVSGQDDATASALLAYRVGDSRVLHAEPPPSRAAQRTHTSGGRLAGSAYMGAGGAQILESAGDWSCMLLPLQPNEGATGRVHEGAVVGLVDTCAALAAFRGLPETSRPASATVSLSIAWTGTLDGDLGAGARLIGHEGTSYTCEAEVWSQAERRLRASSLICYRLADSSR
jgi:uncharacterized protein (TIGR00369 family)